MLKKSTKNDWGQKKEDQNNELKDLKKELTEQPTLELQKRKMSFMIETDVSKYAMGVELL